jgi:ribonuclease III
LGDAYIEVIATRLIWSQFPSLSPGRMSSIRETLVKNETLAEYSFAYGFDKRLNIEDGARPQNKLTQTKVMGDLFESYVAAVVLSEDVVTANMNENDLHRASRTPIREDDQSNSLTRPRSAFETAEQWLSVLWTPLLASIQPQPTSQARWKDDLRHLVGNAKGVKLVYIDERPPLKLKGVETYYIGVYLTGWGYENQHLGSGEALSKKAAGMMAAKNALENENLMKEVKKAKADMDNQRQEATDKEQEQEAKVEQGEVTEKGAAVQ